MSIKFHIAGLLALLLNLTFVVAQKKNDPANNFKIVGYYFLNAALRDTTYADSNYLFLNQLTHLNIAFINPDSAGIFKQDLKIDTLVKKAHEKNVKVLASIAGGGTHSYYAILLRQDNRRAFITELIRMVTRYNLDGIDVDLEGSDIDENYGSFVAELATALKRQKKIITAAIATAYKDQLPDKALKRFDFVNIMSYDRTGPWTPASPGNHSPFSMAQEDLDYWGNVRAIQREKLVLGLPFYGYGFGALDSPVLSMDYRQIVLLYPGSDSLDSLVFPQNVTMYYNSASTIKRKTKLAIDKAAGVMIWQLLADSPGENSLLNAIYGIVHKR